MKWKGDVRPSSVRVRHPLGRADHEVPARRQGVDEPRVEGVADLFGEVDDGVTAHDQVVLGPLDGHSEQVADLEARHAQQLRLRLPSTFIGSVEPTSQ